AVAPDRASGGGWGPRPLGRARPLAAPWVTIRQCGPALDRRHRRRRHPGHRSVLRSSCALLSGYFLHPPPSQPRIELEAPDPAVAQGGVWFQFQMVLPWGRGRGTYGMRVGSARPREENSGSRPVRSTYSPERGIGLPALGPSSWRKPLANGMARAAPLAPQGSSGGGDTGLERGA